MKRSAAARFAQTYLQLFNDAKHIYTRAEVAESGNAYAWKTTLQAYGSHGPFGFKSITLKFPTSA
jgi:hypothetical protein